MNKLLPWLFVLAALLCLTGSVDLPVPYLPRAAGDGYIAMNGVCSAPSSLLPALCDRFPALVRAPELIRHSQELIEAWMPDITLPIPAESGSLIDRVIVKAAPRFL